jgi:protein-S-isoprenylcysteine O-methyltransferase Ste14
MLILHRLPPLFAALCLTVYWGAVVVKLIRLGRKLGKDPNALPRERVGQMMRVIWYPVIILLLIGAWWMVADSWRAIPPHEGANGFAPLWIATPATDAVAAIASAIAIVVTALTFICWHKMGRSWRIGIDPGETTEMIHSGPYRYVRHPIYALRMILGPVAFLALPSIVVGVTAAIDLLLLQIEARREESYMIQKHGSRYEQYRRQVGRFLPRRARG